MGCEGENHKEHMCQLRMQMNMELLMCLSDKPTVECANCHVKANSERNVCRPVKLQG